MSSLISTMAILLANYDERRDYLSNFEPFILDRLKAWPEGQPVRPKTLAESMGAAFTLPSIPINTVTGLRDRARTAGYLTQGKSDGKDYPNREALAAVPEIAPHRTETLAHFNSLTDSVQSYAAEAFEIDWSIEQAETALEGFMEEFGVEMAMARHEGAVGGASRASDEALVVVHSFARRAVERDPAQLQYLEEMVKGSMLTNVIYFQDLGSWSPTLDKLVVFLDTPFVLRVLGIQPDEVTTAALELMHMLAEFKVPIRIFDHTVEEVLGVLEAVKHSLTRARRNEFDSQTVSAIHRESIEHLLQHGWGAGDVQEIISDIDARLQALGVVSQSTPSYTRRLAVDETRFENELEAVGYTQEHQILKDVRSLTAIHRLREGRPCRDLAKAPGIFLTSNWRLVHASDRFFREAGHQSAIPQCISDVSLTTQLWLRKPGEDRHIPRKVLMAESYAALNPSADLWSRYLKKIAKRKIDGGIDDRQVKVLVLSGGAREGLLEVTRGRADRVTDETPLEVLARFEEIARRPAAEEARQATQSLEETQRENEGLRSETKKLREQSREQADRLQSQDRQIGDQYRKLEDLEAWRRQEQNQARQTARRVRQVRRVVGVLLAAAFTGAVVAVGLTDAITEPLLLSMLAVAATLAGVASIGWGFERPPQWTWKTVVAIAVVGGLLGLFYGILLGESPPTNHR
ncbi:MAG: hypothetical protein ACRDLL_07450 [Solirubrobacterales bacterium]